MIPHKGIYYFDSYDEVRDYAKRHKHHTDRIVYNYTRGWAIQLHKPGSYVGTDLITYDASEPTQ